MKKVFFNVAVFTFLSTNITAQLSGTLSVPGTYSSIAAAINDLNTQGVNGATTLQISANYTETVPTGGFSLTATGTAINPIVFQKTGTGANPLLLAYSGGIGTPTTAVQDGIWKLIGSDYITIDGIDLLDQNTANPATMEFGFGLFKASATNGCRNNTIKNCVITLSRINNAPGVGPVFAGSKGIEMINSLVNSHTLAVTVTAGSGANSNNHFYSNTIQNCNIGIALSGPTVAVTSANIDANNDVGGNIAATGNTILNYGTGTNSNGNRAYAIRSLNQQSLNVAYNAINTSTSSGVTLYGIYLQTTFNMTIANNSITISGADIYGIYAAGSGGTSGDVINNSVVNCVCVTPTPVFFGIYCWTSPEYLNINNNVVSGLTIPATTGSSFVYGLSLSNTSTGQCTLSIASNTVENMTNLNANVDIYGVYLYTGNQTSYTVQGNYINNISKQSGYSRDLYGICNEGTSSSWTPNSGYVRNNTINQLSNGGSGNIYRTYGIYYFTDDYTSQNLSGNFINNITGGDGDTHGAYMREGHTGSAANSNTITNISSTGNIYGLLCEDMGYTIGVNGNTIGGLMSSGSSTVFGIKAEVNNFSMSKNKIYDISSNGLGSAYVYGIDALTITGHLSNNMVGDLRTPNSDYPNAIVGINLKNYGNSGAAYNVYYNTVRIDAVSSSGIYFGAVALSSAGGGTITLRNNILINLAIPSGSSSVVAFKRITSSFSTYTTSSNNNLFYAGTPSANNLIYTDGTNNAQTLSAFKTLVSPREAASITENTPFLSVVGTSSNFLHVSPPSLAESNAVNISGITNDIDGNVRQGNSGYIGNGTAPDIGADEFGTPLCSTVNPSTLSPTSLSICAGQTVSITRAVTSSAVFAGTQLQWQRSSSPGGPYSLVAVASPTSSAYNTPTLTPGTYYYTFASTCSISTQTAVSNEVTVSVSSYPQPTVSPTVPVICSGSSPSVIITAIGANTFSWSPSTSLSSSTGATVSAFPATTSTYILTGINPGGCIGSRSLTVYVYPNPTVSVSGNTIVCSGTNVNLTANGANSYSWSTGATQAAISPVISTATIYSVIGTSTLGNCKSNAQHTVYVNPTPTLTANGATVLCAGQSATLSVTGADTYLWSNNATTNSIIVTPPVSLSYNVVGSYTSTGCTGSAQQIVTVVQTPVINITGPNMVCLGEAANLNANGATSYTWNTGTTSAGINITPTTNTNYSVVGVSGPGCSGFAIKTISVNPIPSASITALATSVICEGESIQLVASSDLANLFNWSNGTNSATIDVSPTTSTTYSVVVKNSLTNCSNTATYDLTIDPCTRINKVSVQDLIKLQPNPFHLKFSIDWYGDRETQVEIFNSTGNLIMTTNIQSGRSEINMEKFAKGLYYLKVNSEVKKIVSD